MGRKIKNRPDHGGKNQYQELNVLLHQIQDQRLRSGQTLNSISKLYDKNSLEQRSFPSYKTKLKSLISNSMCETQQEIEIIQKALNKISKMENKTAAQSSTSHSGPASSARQTTTQQPRKTMRRGFFMTLLQQKANQLPTWNGPKSETPAALTGTVPADSNYICTPGDDVAALCDDVADDNWILAEVYLYNSNSNKYQVKDIEEDESGENSDKHTLSRRRVIPLPLRKLNPATHGHLLFQPKHKVLALYPQTTCFYPATIHKPPETEQDDYQVMFYDNYYAEGYAPPLPVPQRYVLDFKDKKRK